MKNYQYSYAVIMLDSGLCIEVVDCTDYIDHEEYPDYIEIPEYNEDYLLKYYNQTNGKWYEDADFTIEAEGLNP